MTNVTAIELQLQNTWELWLIILSFVYLPESTINKFHKQKEYNDFLN